MLLPRTGHVTMAMNKTCIFGDGMPASPVLFFVI